MNKQKLEEINLKLQKENPITAIDGITDYEEYQKASPKILWILKEPNQSGKPHADDMRNFHQNVTRYHHWKKTYNKMIKVSYSIINKCSFEEIPPVDEIFSILKKVAVINVKKTGGTSISYQPYINQAYGINKSIIHDQISFISPDIIINSSRVWGLFSDLPGDQYHSINNFNVKYFDNKTFINAYHPNCRMSEKKYIDLIKECVFKPL